jgi:phosphatidate phosphatase APP1
LLQVLQVLVNWLQMKARKTIEVEVIKERVNRFLAQSRNEDSQVRKGHHGLATILLMDVGAYKGFHYLRKEDVAPGLTFGVEWVDGKPVFHDETRTYFI